MLTKGQLKEIRALKTRKGRRKAGRCLVEGQKAIEAAGDAVVYTFSSNDIQLEDFDFYNLVDTASPQSVAAVATIPEWDQAAILARPTVVVLDGVQDPGNVGSILRLARGFNASLVFVESADPTSPKVVRSSAGVMFDVPWTMVKRENAEDWIRETGRPVVQMDAHGGEGAIDVTDPIVLIAGSEGQGVKLDIAGADHYTIPHNDALESLNVGHAVAIALARRYQHVKGASTL